MDFLTDSWVFNRFSDYFPYLSMLEFRHQICLKKFVDVTVMTCDRVTLVSTLIIIPRWKCLGLAINISASMTKPCYIQQRAAFAWTACRVHTLGSPTMPSPSSQQVGQCLQPGRLTHRCCTPRGLLCSWKLTNLRPNRIVMLFPELLQVWLPKVYCWELLRLIIIK